MRYLLNEEVERVYAETERGLNTEHEDMLLGFIRFRSGTVGVLDINWLTPEKVRRLRVLGERGTYELDYIEQTLYFAPRREDGTPSPRFRIWPERDGVQEEPLRVELSAFIDAVRSGGPSPVSGNDALAAVDLAAQLVRSGEEHRPIEVSHPLEVR
jgi:predicted dehydrogenase